MMKGVTRRELLGTTGAALAVALGIQLGACKTAGSPKPKAEPDGGGSGGGGNQDASTAPEAGPELDPDARKVKAPIAVPAYGGPPPRRRQPVPNKDD